jgi:hypothetical protein
MSDYHDDHDVHDGNGWSEYQRLVLGELTRHNNVLELLAQEIGSLKVELALFDKHHERLSRIELEQRGQDVEIATLKVKAGLWGGMAGLVTALAAALVHLTKGGS